MLSHRQTPLPGSSGRPQIGGGSVPALPRAGCALWFAGFGLLALAQLTWMAYPAFRPYAWREVECTILSRGIAVEARQGGGQDALPFVVEYEYRFSGQGYRSSRYASGYLGGMDSDEAMRLVERYPVGSRATAYVNPSRPQEAVLYRPSLFFLLPLVVPLLFMFFGYLAWRDGGRVRTEAAAATPPAPSGKDRPHNL